NYSQSLDTRDQHSFPTRRSSDLSWTFFNNVWYDNTGNDNNIISTIGIVIGDEKVSVGTQIVDSILSEISSFFDAIAADNKRMLSDRKSTRLNSSHVKISYAVFCL